jgi:hypothetical protein
MNLFLYRGGMKLKNTTLLNLEYLGRVKILVLLENGKDYSLHLNSGGEVVRFLYRDLEGEAKEKLVANLISVERYHFWQKIIEECVEEEDIRWDASYLQLVQFIETLRPGYIFKWLYLHKERTVKNGNHWISYYVAHPANYNIVLNNQVVFEIHHDIDKVNEKIVQSVHWKTDREMFAKYNDGFNKTLMEIKENEYLQYRQVFQPILPNLFEGFEDLLDD